MLHVTLPGDCALLATVRSATCATMCAALVACAGSAEPGPPTSIRTRPPQGFEKTINSYFAFRIRNPRKNTEILVDQPEPGDCPLDGDLSSRRGWVVPVVYATRTGEATGKEVIHITSRQYYFWFLEDTIAGITTRMELCPGAVAISFEDMRTVEAADAAAVAAAPHRTGVSSRDVLDRPEKPRAIRSHERTRSAAHRKETLAHAAKNAGPSSGKVRPLKTGTEKDRQSRWPPST